MEIPYISYCASEQQTWFQKTNKEQTWFQKTNKATPHGTPPLPHVTYLLCVCTDTYLKLIDGHTHIHYMFLNASFVICRTSVKLAVAIGVG